MLTLKKKMDYNLRHKILEHYKKNWKSTPKAQIWDAEKINHY